MQLREIHLPVVYKNSVAEKRGEISLMGANTTVLTFSGNRENSLRSAIASLFGIEQQVLNDLYRNLVLANFTRFNGISGRTAEPELNREYPASGILPEFELKSGAYNAAGMVVYNLLCHPENYKVGYRVLAGLLENLVNTGILDEPQIDISLDSFEKFSLPDELEETEAIYEGALRRVIVNVYERKPEARRKCINHYGSTCAVCDFDFRKVYGAIGEGYIHVHHLRQLADIGERYEVDPIQDLRPVCPNCHAMIHKRRPAYSIEEMRELRNQVRL